MLKIVLDTNVIISALFWRGNPHRLLKACTSKFKLIISPELLKELETVLKREKKFGLSDEEIENIIESIAGISEIVFTKKKLNVVKHESDNRILECAIEGKADYIISGDKHLISLKNCKIKILKPSQAVKSLLL